MRSEAVFSWGVVPWELSRVSQLRSPPALERRSGGSVSALIFHGLTGPRMRKLSRMVVVVVVVVVVILVVDVVVVVVVFAWEGELLDRLPVVGQTEIGWWCWWW